MKKIILVFCCLLVIGVIQNPNLSYVTTEKEMTAIDSSTLQADDGTLYSVTELLEIGQVYSVKVETHLNYEIATILEKEG